MSLDKYAAAINPPRVSQSGYHPVFGITVYSLNTGVAMGQGGIDASGTVDDQFKIRKNSKTYGDNYDSSNTP